MKRLLFSLVASAVALGSAHAQKMTEPEYVGQVNYVGTDSTVTLLEVENTEMKTKSNGLGFVPVAGMFLSKGQSYLVIKGAKSKTKLSGDNVTLIARVKENDEDPKSKIGIIKFEPKKKERRYLMAEAGLLSMKNKTAYSDFKFDAKKFGKASYLIKVEKLEPGEYGIITNDFGRLSTFTVE